VSSEEHTEETGAEESPSNGDGEANGRNLGRVAALAAASGATAFAARKALGSRSSSASSDDDESQPKKKSGSSSDGASLMTAAVSSGWDVAKDSLLPVIEDAATKAGAFVADRAPEVVRDVVVPRFIAGFQRAKRGSSDD
jgi:hypothetical protein